MANPEQRGIKYVLSEYQGFIVEVFQVERWYSTEIEQGRMRWAFDGRVAPDEIRNQYFNRKISKKRGASNPISYNLQLDTRKNGLA
jgi:hypothetical protein